MLELSARLQQLQLWQANSMSFPVLLCRTSFRRSSTVALPQVGLEPTLGGFSLRCLCQLGYGPRLSLRNRVRAPLMTAQGFPVVLVVELANEPRGAIAQQERHGDPDDDGDDQRDPGEP